MSSLAQSTSTLLYLTIGIAAALATLPPNCCRSTRQHIVHFDDGSQLQLNLPNAAVIFLRSSSSCSAGGQLKQEPHAAGLQEQQHEEEQVQGVAEEHPRAPEHPQRQQQPAQEQQSAQEQRPSQEQQPQQAATSGGSAGPAPTASAPALAVVPVAGPPDVEQG